MGGGGRNCVLPGSAETQTILHQGEFKWKIHCDETFKVCHMLVLIFLPISYLFVYRCAAFKEKRLCELLYLCLHCFRLAKEVGVYRLWKNYWTIFTPPLFITIWFQQPRASQQICCLDFWGKYFLNISKFNIFPTTEWQEEEEGRLLSTQLSGEQQQQQQDGFRPGRQLLKGVNEVSRNTIFVEGIYFHHPPS